MAFGASSSLHLTKHHSSDKIKKNDMGGAYSTYGGGGEIKFNRSRGRVTGQNESSRNRVASA